MKLDNEDEINIDTVSVDIKPIIEYYLNNDVFLEKTEPAFKYIRSHDSHYSARIQIGDNYFFEEILAGQLKIEEDHKNPIGGICSGIREEAI